MLQSVIPLAVSILLLQVLYYDLTLAIPFNNIKDVPQNSYFELSSPNRHSLERRLPTGTCDANTPCENAACCGTNGLCGYSPTECGQGELENPSITRSTPSSPRLTSFCRELHFELRCQSFMWAIWKAWAAKLPPRRLLLTVWVSPTCTESLIRALDRALEKV